jgi:uncharacterized protein YdiU (UPF0061 family)
MAAGFVHGVLNTDNLNVTGESFDYGPWRFVPTSDPSFTAAYFDESGLYAFGRQPEAVSWALAQLGGALSIVCPASQLEPALGLFAPAYQQALRDRLFARLHLCAGEVDADLGFLQSLFDWLTQSAASWDQFFHDWYGGGASSVRAAASPQAALYAADRFSPVRDGLESRSQTDAQLRLGHAYFRRVTPHTMLIEEVETLWAAIAERDDWALFEAKLAQITEMRDAFKLSVHTPFSA